MTQQNSFGYRQKLGSSIKNCFTVSCVGLALLVAAGGCTKKSKPSDGMIHYPLSANVKGTDPAFVNDLYSNTVASQIYEPLYHFNYLKRPLEIEPLLAVGLPQVSDDGLTHTIKLRTDIVFHNDPAFPDGQGRKVRAEDFIYAWKRLADPSNNSDGFWIFDGRIEGLNEWRENMRNQKATYASEVSGLKALDEHTIQIKLVRPYYQLHYVLAMTYTAPVPKEAIEKYGREFINHPVGTGPFYLDSWTRNSQIVLKKYPGWRAEVYPNSGEVTDREQGLLEDAGKTIPFVEGIVFHEITEDQPRWLNFMRGELDIVSIPKDNFAGSVQGIELSAELKSKGVKLDISTEPDLVYIAFQMKDPILGKNDYLRKAMALAFDNQVFIDKFYNGRGVLAHGPIAPDVPGYDPEFRNPYSEFNLEKARDFMKKAGFPDGKGLPEFEYSTMSTSTSRQMAEFFQQSMQKLGIRIKVATSSWPQFLQKLKESKAQIWGAAWLADYPDAENFLQLLYGKNKAPGPNSSNFDDAEFNRLYEKAATLPPGPARSAVYTEMRDRVVGATPWIFNAHRKYYGLHHQWLKNFKHHAVILDGIKYWRIDNRVREEGKAKL